MRVIGVASDSASAAATSGAASIAVAIAISVVAVPAIVQVVVAPAHVPVGTTPMEPGRDVVAFPGLAGFVGSLGPLWACIGGFGDTTMIARLRPRRHQGYP